jgi:hypothetical protein
MKIFLFVSSLIVFIVSAAVHFCAVYEFDWLYPSMVMPLQAIVLLLFASLFIKSKNKAAIKTASPPSSKKYWISVFLLAFFLMSYVAFNFIACAIELRFASPAIWSGEYVLQSHGSLVKKLTLSEYTHYQYIEARLFSGHWLIFSFVPMVFYFYNIKNVKWVS